MTKTLWMQKEKASNFELPVYIKITATKISDIETGIQNLYRDDEGNKYIVKYNKFQRREEFVRL